MTLPKYELWRDENFGRLLLHAFRSFERKLLRRLADVGFGRVRTVHLRVMRQVDMGGTRVSTLAERAGITKQAMSQLVAECVRRKLLRTAADPADRRARIVRFTPLGTALIESARTLIVGIEAEVAAMLGAERNQRLTSALIVLADSYHQTGAPRLGQVNGHRILTPPPHSHWSRRRTDR
jgi:DNA-binding MarR family transcriptional regulator